MSELALEIGAAGVVIAAFWLLAYALGWQFESRSWWKRLMFAVVVLLAASGAVAVQALVRVGGG